jgi:hypothetical protein
VERYQGTGAQGIVKNTESIDIPIDEKLEYLTNSFYMKQTGLANFL